MARPAVSVLLPVRDAGRHLEACLESLARQSFDDFEVVAVDDGSRDGSAAVLDRWAARDRRFAVLHRPPAGLIAALNAGLERCRAPLVARMDADDVAAPRRLELQVRAFAEEPRLDVVSCLVRHVPWQHVGEGFRVYERWLNGLLSHRDILRERFIESPIAHPSAMVRRQRLLEVGGYRDRGWPEDYDLWLRLAARGARFAKVPQVLHFWREHAGRLTRVDRRYAVERFLECKAHHLLRGPLRRAPRVIVWGAGQTGRRLSKHLLRGGAPIAAFVDVDRRKIGRRLRGLPIHDAARLEELRQPGDDGVVLAAVSSRGARALIRRRLAAAGLEEGGDFWCVA
ncbi:MAG: glycosyltransferase [Acidobacteria bacterium]|nr:MAG: glycosyltransferase [Acidobacteriota bacterium]